MSEATFQIYDETNGEFAIELWIKTEDKTLAATDFTRKVKELIAEWIETTEGQDALHYTCGMFNWGDFVHFLDRLVDFSDWLLEAKARHVQQDVLLPHDQDLLPTVCPYCKENHDPRIACPEYSALLAPHVRQQ